MKLQSKDFHITDATGKKINVEEQNIILSLNDKKLETHLNDVFNPEYLEFENGKIYGNSLLSYYQINEDGTLGVEGSKIQLLNAETNEPILIKKITRDSLSNDDEIVSFDLIKKFVEYFNVSKPEDVFENLNIDEKQYFIDERIAASEKKKVAASAIAAAKAKEDEESNKKAEKEKAAAKAESDRIEKEKKKADDEKVAADAAEKARIAKEAEKTLKASIDPKLVHDKKSYKEDQFFYNRIGFKEYINHPYHLFYAKTEDQEPCVLIRRGDTWWEECFDTTLIDENDQMALIQFTDGETLKQMALDVNTGEIKITDAEGAE